jgi:hypothetical protein
MKNAKLYFLLKSYSGIIVMNNPYTTELNYIQPETILNPNKKTDQDFIDFIFSIQDFYVFNPQAFEEMIDNLNAFLYLRDKIFIDSVMCNYYYQIADSKKNNMLNSLHSILFNLPNNGVFTGKINLAHKRLETLLNREINKMYLRCAYYVKIFGPDIYKRSLETDKVPKAYNNYFDQQFTYQFY